MSKLINDISNTIMIGITDTFFICSDNLEWKYIVTQKMIETANELKKQIRIIDYKLDPEDERNYPGIKAVTDMFCLSRCKAVLQGTKYSTFSILASLIGDNELRNYHCDKTDNTLLHLWRPCLTLNTNKWDGDEALQIKMSKGFDMITPLFIE